jgi:hypothetical protein
VKEAITKNRRAQSPLAKGLRLYHRGLFFEAHEEWEGLWRHCARASEKRLLQGLIQIAAGFHKLNAQGNRKGARYLLERALEKFSGVPEGFGLDWNRLRGDLERSLQDLRGSKIKPNPPRIKTNTAPGY